MGASAVIAMRRTMLVLVLGACAWSVQAYGGRWWARQMSDFAPQVVWQAPPNVPTEPFSDFLPEITARLWLPWVSQRMERDLLAARRDIRRLGWEKELGSRRIVVRVEPRRPLARWGRDCLDAEGVVFHAPEAGVLPEIDLHGTAARARVGRWLWALAQQGLLWPKIRALREDRDGAFRVELESGLQLWWGPADADLVPEKTRRLFQTLTDARQNLPAVSQVDLRFFSEGRIIVATHKSTR